ncbi:hypothetical protein AURDEDRAFT_158566 [Auricularia subglabra TFB-10046 SS5]|nr:hypothetical protein AURDEDRAFT_158566 [Auricularia subglabra TFB-10046 SS5]
MKFFAVACLAAYAIGAVATPLARRANPLTITNDLASVASSAGSLKKTADSLDNFNAVTPDAPAPLTGAFSAVDSDTVVDALDVAASAIEGLMGSASAILRLHRALIHHSLQLVAKRETLKRFLASEPIRRSIVRLQAAVEELESVLIRLLADRGNDATSQLGQMIISLQNANTALSS